ncbi:MAG: pyridoxamine 5'-phosphate oxidase family protein [Verrucomicrobia bacterium]|nr:pyridoxamine 5'-phosphate oxidase family protein [Cytophagales bacterium]
MIGELNEEEIEQMLHSQVVGRIGCYAEGRVYVVPITYAYDGQYVYGYTLEGQKIAMMRQNPTICFEIDQFENMFNWKSVIMQGIFEELSGEDQSQAASVMKNRVMPFLQEEHQQVIYRINLVSKSGRFEKK